jgi:hypothetical protein
MLLIIGIDATINGLKDLNCYNLLDRIAMLPGKRWV